MRNAVKGFVRVVIGNRLGAVTVNQVFAGVSIHGQKRGTQADWI
jgi:hypothetical protein